MLALTSKLNAIMTKISTFILPLLAFFVLSCAEDSADISAAASSGSGVGGSLARFTIIGDYLYTVDHTTLATFDISAPEAPEKIDETVVTQGVETIFPLKDHLLLGTQNGMYIYRVSDNGLPAYVSEYQHVVSCDPVVANQNYAYVTLRVSECREAAAGAANTLDVIDISNIESPNLVNSLSLDGPYGLGLDGNVLFVCEGSNGLRVFNLDDPESPQEIRYLNDINAIDVIPLGGTLLVVGPDALLQLDYTDINNIQVISEITIGA
jgi:hypothetical protein